MTITKALFQVRDETSAVRAEAKEGTVTILTFVGDAEKPGDEWEPGGFDEARLVELTPARARSFAGALNMLAEMAERG